MKNAEFSNLKLALRKVSKKSSSKFLSSMDNERNHIKIRQIIFNQIVDFILSSKSEINNEIFGETILKNENSLSKIQKAKKIISLYILVRLYIIMKKTILQKYLQKWEIRALLRPIKEIVYSSIVEENEEFIEDKNYIKYSKICYLLNKKFYSQFIAVQKAFIFWKHYTYFLNNINPEMFCDDYSEIFKSRENVNEYANESLFSNSPNKGIHSENFIKLISQKKYRKIQSLRLSLNLINRTISNRLKDYLNRIITFGNVIALVRIRISKSKIVSEAFILRRLFLKNIKLYFQKWKNNIEISKISIQLGIRKMNKLIKLTRRKHNLQKIKFTLKWHRNSSLITLCKKMLQ